VKDFADIVIVGGGVIGLSVAYHLGRQNDLSVRLYEQNQISSGTSWHAAGIVGPLRSTLSMAKLAMQALELFPELEDETGHCPGFRQTGGYWLAQTEQRMHELRRIAAVGNYAGLDVDMQCAEEISRAVPLLKTQDLAGGLFVQQDGEVSPVDLCSAYAAGARARGVSIKENCSVDKFIVSRGRIGGVCLTDGRVVECEKVALCAGLWSRELAQLAGVGVPLQAIEHMYIVTEPIDALPQPTPVLRDLDAGIYIKSDAGKLVLGGFEKDPKPWDPSDTESAGGFLMFDQDWNHFEGFMHAGMHRIPILENVGVQLFLNGPESFTPDTKPMIGESPEVENFFIAAGFNSVGIMSSAGAGDALAKWIANGSAPYDLWEVDVARADPLWTDDAFLKERIREAVHNQFAMHWPLKQPKFGRNLRHSSITDTLKEQNAVFGCTASWERPLWHGTNRDEIVIEHTYEHQPWWHIAEREANQMKDGVGFAELSPFAKFDIFGPDAESALQYLCAGDISIGVNTSRYTVMLNAQGGIQADVTVTRRSDMHFRIVGAAATRFRESARIRRILKDFSNVEFADLTDMDTVIGVFGAKSRQLLSELFDECDLSNASFPFGSFAQTTIKGLLVFVVRRSYVGELGWEIYIPCKHAKKVYDLLWQAGKSYQASHLGYLALNGCRLEKGFGHWGYEWGSHVTPIEAGLEFAVNKSKKSYLGCEALQRQRQIGVRKRLLLFEVVHDASSRPLLIHDEPVTCDDNEIVGLTTSGGLGPRTGKSIAFAILDCEPDESLFDLRRRSYSIEVAGQHFEAKALDEPPYDPDGMRMRG